MKIRETTIDVVYACDGSLCNNPHKQNHIGIRKNTPTSPARNESPLDFGWIQIPSLPNQILDICPTCRPAVEGKIARKLYAIMQKYDAHSFPIMEKLADEITKPHFWRGILEQK